MPNHSFLLLRKTNTPITPSPTKGFTGNAPRPNDPTTCAFPGELLEPRPLISGQSPGSKTDCSDVTIDFDAILLELLREIDHVTMCLNCRFKWNEWILNQSFLPFGSAFCVAWFMCLMCAMTFMCDCCWPHLGHRCLVHQIQIKREKEWIMKSNQRFQFPHC